MIRGIVFLQRLDDAGQVDADGAVGLAGPPGRDGVDDGQMLRQRHIGTPWPLGELELMPDELRVQTLKQFDRDGLPGDHPDTAVQFPVELGVLQRVPVPDRALEVLRELAQLSGLALGYPFRGLRRAQRLQCHPALGNCHGFPGRDDPYPGAAVGDALDEPVGGEIKQRRPQRLPRYAECPGQILLNKPLTGGKIPAEDGLPQHAEGMRPGRLPGPRPVGRSCCHALTLRRKTVNCQQLPAGPVGTPLPGAGRLGAGTLRRRPGAGSTP